jgi:hypothetical protein
VSSPKSIMLTCYRDVAMAVHSPSRTLARLAGAEPGVPIQILHGRVAFTHLIASDVSRSASRLRLATWPDHRRSRYRYHYITPLLTPAGRQSPRSRRAVPRDAVSAELGDTASGLRQPGGAHFHVTAFHGSNRRSTDRPFGETDIGRPCGCLHDANDLSGVIPR